MRNRAMWLLAGLVVIAGHTAAAQTVTDQMVSKFNGEVIMQSDVRHARVLKLVKVGAGAGDDVILVALENRRLVLAELARSAPVEPSADERAARRREWEGALEGANIASLLAQAGMSDAALDAWLRDDVRIQKYVDQRVAGMPASDRAASIDQWIQGLRRRAGLKAKSE
jgi:hypothetical protein